MIANGNDVKSVDTESVLRLGIPRVNVTRYLDSFPISSVICYLDENRVERLIPVEHRHCVCEMKGVQGIGVPFRDWIGFSQ
jgi:hypothetical protein